ncbi:Zinc finger, BED-type [Quillaja saponaria]|uniref:Zinc finger, BED-type n=1 Tax=Quillaja saponaria TaxID=32244 RepID=A0AAD7PLG1_QUISA|nr:Zinc finger, BED-type [Quillaja saponaria]
MDDTQGIPLDPDEVEMLFDFENDLEASNSDQVGNKSKRKEFSKPPFPGKKRAKTSWIWEHVTHVKGTSGLNRRSTCNWCGITYASHSKKNGNSNLGTHLKYQCKKFSKHLVPG